MYKLAQLLAHEVCVYERLCSMATTVDLGNVIGPQGPQGTQGIQGPKGDTGPAGANWYVLNVEHDYKTNKFVAIDETDVSDAFNHYPYVVCHVSYNRITAAFVPTAYYSRRNNTTNKDESCIQFSCLTLKDTANDANMTIQPYYNCIVICEDGTITGSVRDVDPAVQWNNIQNKPFSSIHTSNGVFNVDEAGEFSIKCAAVIANCLEYPSNGFITTQYKPEQDTFTLDFAPAGENQLGIVQVGNGLNVAADGTLSCAVNNLVPSVISAALVPEAKDNTCVAIGALAQAHSDSGDANGVAIGYMADADKKATAVGSNALAHMASIAVGQQAAARSTQDIAIGSNASTTQANQNLASGNNIAIGTNAKCSNTAQTSIAIGCQASVYKGSSISIGNSAYASDDGDIAIGNDVRVLSNQSVAIGSSVDCADGANFSVAIGNNASTAKASSVCIGHSAVVTGTNSVAIGDSSSCNYVESVALGHGSKVLAAYEVSVGDTNTRRRVTNVASPTKSYDAVNLMYFQGRTPVTVKITDSIATSTAALNTNKTFAGFPNISITDTVYNALYQYADIYKLVPDSIIFEKAGISTSPTKSQVFSVSQSQRIYTGGGLNLNVIADCFVNFGMVTNASSTMLNLARVELSMTSKTEIMMNVSSSSAMGFDSNSTYAMYMSFKPRVA